MSSTKIAFAVAAIVALLPFTAECQQSYWSDQGGQITDCGATGCFSVGPQGEVITNQRGDGWSVDQNGDTATWSAPAFPIFPGTPAPIAIPNDDWQPDPDPAGGY